MDNGKFERITVADNAQSSLAQSAITEYRIIGSPCCGQLESVYQANQHFILLLSLYL